MKIRRVLRIVFEEFIANGIGWISGLIAADLVSHFFAARSWKNLWGLASAKVAVKAETFNILEWLAAAIIGFAVLLLVNKLIAQRLLEKIDEPETATAKAISEQSNESENQEEAHRD